MDVNDFLSNLRDESGIFTEPRIERREIVIDRVSGEARQAGTVDPKGQYVIQFRQLCERDLYSFAKGVMGMTLLTPTLHKPVCEWLQVSPPRRKCRLLPRDHLKSSIVGRTLPAHILIQPRDNNLYFPDCRDKNCRYRRKPSGEACTDATHLFDGANTRVLLGYETATNAEAQLRWIEGQWEGNEVLRGLWPHKVWEGSARRQAPVWNQQRMIIPRSCDYPEPSIDTIGVGGAVTGRHYNVHIFDDLCTLEAANSAVVMAATIQWFIASRALMDDPAYSLEFTIGTRWAVNDLYEYIEREDPTVAFIRNSVIENGKPIFPEVFTQEVIDQKRKQFGSLFPLLYMNSAADPELVDFDITECREFSLNDDGSLDFESDPRDETTMKTFGATETPPRPETDRRFVPLSEAVKRAKASGRDEYMAFKYGSVRSW